MIIKAGSILELFPYLNGKIARPEVPFRHKRRILRLAREIEDDYKSINAEIKKIVDKYAERDDAGELISTGPDSFRIPMKNVPLYNAEISAVLESALEYEISESFYRFPESAFEGMECSPDTIDVIEKYFLTEEKQEDKE